MTAQVPDTITIRSSRVSGRLATGEMIYVGVEVLFGPTRVFADKLTVWGDPTVLNLSVPKDGAWETRAVAEGRVRIDDPDGTVTADRVEYDWIKRTGKATNVVVRSERVTVNAESLDFTEAKWILTGVSATTCGRDKPLYLLRTPRLEIQPGKVAIARGLTIALFGHTLGSVPYARFVLDRRVQAFSWPTLSFKDDGRVGLRSQNSFLIGDRAALNSSIATYQGEMMRYDLQLVYSRVPAEQARDVVVPKSEFGERFTFGYLDNIGTKTPADELALLTAPRDSLSIGTYWNHRASARLGGETFIKPWELTYEYGGPWGKAGYLAQARVERIGVLHGRSENRFQLQSSLLLPPVTLGRGLSSHVRLDGAAFTGELADFAWGSAQLGLIFSPLPDVRLGGALVAGGEAGTAAFQADRLYSRMGANFRADWGRGPTKLGFLAKYDFAGRRWYDYEYSVSQIAGCIEPYVVWRRFPDDFAFGVSFRADEFIEKLRRRSLRN